MCFQFADTTTNLFVLAYHWTPIHFFNAKPQASSSAKNSPQEASGKGAMFERLHLTSLRGLFYRKENFVEVNWTTSKFPRGNPYLWPIQLPFVLQQSLNSSPTYIPSKFTTVTHYEFTGISQHKSVSHYIF